jgi:hypothetical protein
MNITDLHYYLDGTVSLFDVTDDMTVYHFTLNATLLFKPNNAVNQVPLVGIIVYDNINSVVLDDTLNHRYYDLPKKVRQDILAKMVEAARDRFTDENKRTP